MKIEAIIVCINYSDFLAVTLPTNKSMFNRVVVVTDEKDIDTVRICKDNNVRCIKTNKVYDGGNVANKAVAINEGLKYLDKDGWVLQMDADIWLPPLTRDILQKYPLEDDCIYGIDRYMCNSYADWNDFINDKSKPIHDGWIFLHMHHFSLGQRIVQYYGEGYMPIGFFQLWNPSKSNVTIYPEEKQGYDRTDVLHLKQFPRNKRKFIPDFICVHLASTEPKMGENWHGRKSIKFGPKVKNNIFMKIFNFLKYHITNLINYIKDKLTKKFYFN